MSADREESEADRVAVYAARHPPRRPAPPPPPVPPTPKQRAVRAAQGIVERASGTPKNVYRFFRKNTPRNLKDSGVLTPARAVLRFYRQHIKKPEPEARTAAASRWRDGRPPTELADEFRCEAFERHRRTVRTSTKTPRIAALVLNRDGAHHLQNLFESILTHEPYPALSVWVIDHGSTDDSRAVLTAYAKRLDLHTVLVDDNRSFSASNNDLARRTDAELVLLLNNDIIFDRPILGDLAAHLEEEPSVGAVGCRLHYPAAHAEYPGGIQHVGIKFYEDATTNFHRPYNLAARDGIRTVHDAPETFPAATAAFLMCRRTDYLAVGGLDEAYVYGYEDVDFCLRLKRDRALDTIVAHQCSAVHDESATQNRDPSDALKARRQANRSFFEARWGHHLRNHIAADRLSGTRFCVDAPLTIGFAVTEAGPDAQAGDYFTARELATALTDEIGCRTAMLPATEDWYDLTGVDVLIAMVDRYDPRKTHSRYPGTVTVGWARNWFDRWAEREGFWDFDLFFVSSKRAAEVTLTNYGRRADVLRIGTHAARFEQGRFDEQLAADVCFTGSHWGAHRDIEDHLALDDIDGSVAIWGAGWDDHPTLASAARGFLPYDRLPDVYASTRVVIDDANHVTKPWGSTNSRVFDAAVSGALVVTNGVVGAKETFGDRLPTYNSREELTRVVNDALRNEPERKRRVEALQKFVLANHTYHHRARRFATLLSDVSKERLRIGIKIAAPSHESKHQWGDYHFALALRRSFARLGHLVRIDLLYEWNDPPGLADDIVLVLRGLSRYEPNPRQVNLMWNISHPDDVSQDEYESYDHVFIASILGAAERTHFTTPVTALLQCTDPALFHPGTQAEAPAEPVLFVGNSRRQHRPVVLDAIAAELPLSIYGGGWKGIVDDGYVRATHVANDALSAYYERAGVVLNDHWPDMRSKGFLSNRLFDAAASGAVIISDPAVGMASVFGDGIETYTTVEELTAIMERIRRRPAEARQRALELSETIRDRHSFDRRAETILEVARSFLADRS